MIKLYFFVFIFFFFFFFFFPINVFISADSQQCFTSCKTQSFHVQVSYTKMKKNWTYVTQTLRPEDSKNRRKYRTNPRPQQLNETKLFSSSASLSPAVWILFSHHWFINKDMINIWNKQKKYCHVETHVLTVSAAVFSFSISNRETSTRIFTQHIQYSS